MSKKSIVLLSGGLDSVVSLAYVKEKSSEILALTFNYGQKSFLAEKRASERIAKFYGAKQKLIDLEWLSVISSSSLNTDSEVPKVTFENLDDKEFTKKSAKSVWVPNRNGLFVNIAASYAEAFGYDSIVIGANKEEAKTFKDNSSDFVDGINHSLKNSVNSKVELIAPLMDLTKEQIVNLGLKLNIPFEMIYSCYASDDKHCGMCESCQRLKRALNCNNYDNLLKKIFG